MELRSLKGIGPKTEALFRKLGIGSLEELLYYFPQSYLSYPPLSAASELEPGEPQAVLGVLEKDASVSFYGGKQLTTAYMRSPDGKRLRLLWFHAAFLRHTLKAGSMHVFYGRPVLYKGSLSMTQPRIYGREEYAEKEGRLEPVYGQTKGLSNALILKALHQLFSSEAFSSELRKKTESEEALPESLRSRRRLPGLWQALRQIHFPDSREALSKGRRRLAYEELFLFSMAMSAGREKGRRRASCITEKRKETDRLLNGLPFTLTEGQRSAIREIREELSSGFLMNRLLQGDVGSGKTLVAFAAMLEVGLNGYQAALMAPTELLAIQHYEKLTAFLSEHGLPLTAALLTGSTASAEKRRIYEEAETGKLHLLVGTHALFQEKLRYASLSLVVTDEQHRFGVNQRKSLAEKGLFPHILVMSATPIPRTLAMLLYADMEISVIKEKPADRLPIRNAVVGEEERQKAYRFLYGELKKGRQAYVICPMVEANDQLELENVTEYTEKLKKLFPEEIRIEGLHGKLRPEKKEAVMQRFLRQETDVLVSTTVVEVGVDVPNATVMLVENAERFGLAQLHQLRGRVGRSGHQSYCIFIDTKGSKSSKKRLSVLSSSNDGFYIAEEDLRLRGPGDIFGVRQSGELDFSVADIYEDAGLLREAAEDAGRILSEDPELLFPEHRRLGERLSDYRKERTVL